MIRQILCNCKTQTRRIVKLPRWSTGDWSDFEVYPYGIAETICAETGCAAPVYCPYGKAGDRLWVRETWIEAPEDYWDDYHYKATFDNLDILPPAKWKPSIHMPRAASRITLEITDVRVERLQQISDEDAIAEGIQKDEWFGMITVRGDFQKLWDSINESRGYGWDTNPWIWCISFKRVGGAS